MKKHSKIDWFKDWFNSPYYHLLYRHRNHSEAEFFIDNLFKHLKQLRRSSVLDLACGKGRHAKQLSELGFNVIGVDLSEKSIKEAQQFAHDRLQFEIGDMRSLRFKNHFDLVLNLFTSFGYFRRDGDNIKVIQSISNALKNGGYLVLDYLNADKIKRMLPEQEEINREGVQFKILKKIEDSFIKKEINFTIEGKTQQYQEFVRLFNLEDFKRIFEQYNMQIVSTFGDYDLTQFDSHESDRLILIAKKI